MIGAVSPASVAMMTASSPAPGLGAPFRPDIEQKESPSHFAISLPPTTTSRSGSSMREVSLSIAAYSFCSISMILLNKLVMGTYKLNFPVGLLCLQNFCALALVAVGKQFGFITFPDFDLAVARRWIPLTLFFVTMLYTSMKSLFLMSVAAQTVLKNLAIVFTALGEQNFFGKEMPKGMYGSFGLMLVGSYFASVGDPWVTPWGLFWTFLNIISTVCYVLYMNHLLDRVTKSQGKYGPVFYNNLLSLPFLLPAAIVQDLPGLYKSLFYQEIEVPADDQLSPWIPLLLMLAVGATMSFAVFWCMRVTGPTTYSVVGALNKVPLAVLGIFLFHHHPTPVGWLGISCALFGGFLYAVLNARAKSAKETSAPLSQAVGEGKSSV